MASNLRGPCEPGGFSLGGSAGVVVGDRDPGVERRPLMPGLATGSAKVAGAEGGETGGTQCCSQHRQNDERGRRDRSRRGGDVTER